MIALGLLVPFFLLGAVIAGIAALAKRNHEEPPDGLARRLVLSALTFGMTVIAAVGVFIVLDVAFGSARGMLRGSSDISQGLAMLIVGLPAAFALWRYQLRALAGPDGRSIIWLLHQSIAIATFAIGTVVALGNGLRFRDSGARGALAFGVAWLGAWLFHEWVGSRRPVPVLPGLPRAIAAGIGLVTAAVGAVGLVAALIEVVVGSSVLASTAGADPIVAAAIWTGLGLAVWAWQWFRPHEAEDLSRVALALGLGVGGGAALALGGLTGLLTLMLSATTEGLDTREIGGVVGAIAVGFLVWRYHWTLATSDQHARVARHLVSGLALIAVATGIGVLVNSGLSALTPAFAGRNQAELAWFGLAAVLVNGPVWWAAWRPDRVPHPDAGTAVQRTYLTLLGGVAAVTGAIASIVLVYQLLEGIFDGASASGIIDGIRTPLGFVVATGLVTAYHYRRWAATRQDAPDETPITVERVTFVGPAEVAAEVRGHLGVRVTDWRTPDDGSWVGPGELMDRLRALDATDALVIEDAGGYRVIGLQREVDHIPQTGDPQE